MDSTAIVSEVSCNLSIWAVWLISAVLALMIIGITVMGSIAFHKNTSTFAKYLNALLAGGNALRLITVMAVIMAAVYLGLCNKLTGEVTTLLGSLAAYVLGSLRSPLKEDDPNGIDSINQNG